MKIVAATKNKGKIKEIKNILSESEYEIVSMSDIGIKTDVVEDGATFEENALKKAVEIMSQCNEITLADDSGLVVEALNGEPGIYSARYSGVHGQDIDNNILLLKNMEGKKDRRAKFVCAMALVFPNGRKICVKGEFHGNIGYEMKGSNGFGYDSVFYPLGYDKTSAEISPEEKDKISHRAKALNALKAELTKIKD
ncbi:MAG: XTP/dITP diphosphatase [Clostridia bacterium]|nr:XTP/dITP diphosphatase [Clostridia bacterium]